MPEPVTEDVLPETAPEAFDDPSPFADEIPVEEEPVAYAPEPEPIPAPAPPPEPVRPPRPRIEDFITQPTPRPAATTLAAVVSRTPVSAMEDAPYMPASRMTSKISEEEEQIAFRFGSEEDRGRFQKTEPVLADGGEDLDVPTWMRLKRKLKR